MWEQMRSLSLYGEAGWVKLIVYFIRQAAVQVGRGGEGVTLFKFKNLSIRLCERVASMLKAVS